MPKKNISDLPLTGICYWHVDIDSVGWCFQDSRFIGDNGQYSYEGLHCLKDGDHLTIFLKDDRRKVAWSGVINLASNEGHGVSQKGIELKTWASWFRKEHPAELVPAKEKRRRRK